MRRPFYLGMQAEVCVRAGMLAEGPASTEAALACVEGAASVGTSPSCTGSGASCCSAARGEPEAETALRRAIDVARLANARWLELRAAASLARLLAERGERRQAHDLLAPVHGWFTEGFDAPDLRDARALLDELR